jgi:hypothetical protein
MLMLVSGRAERAAEAQRASAEVGNVAMNKEVMTTELVNTDPE